MNKKIIINIFNMLMMTSSVGLATKAMAQFRPPVEAASEVVEEPREENRGNRTRIDAGGQRRRPTQEEKLTEAVSGTGVYRPPTDPEAARRDAEEVLREGGGGPVIRPAREEREEREEIPGAGTPGIYTNRSGVRRMMSETDQRHMEQAEAYQRQADAWDAKKEELEQELKDTKPGFFRKVFGSEDAERDAKVRELEGKIAEFGRYKDAAAENAREATAQMEKVREFMKQFDKR